MYQIDSGADDLGEAGADAIPQQEDVLAVFVRRVGRIGEVLRSFDGRVQGRRHPLAAGRWGQRQSRHFYRVVQLLDGTVGR